MDVSIDYGVPENDYEKHYQLKEGDLYVEAGAFWGRYGKKALQKVGPTGRILLIEPSPLNMWLLLRNLPKGTPIAILQKALWSSSGIGWLWMQSDNIAQCVHWTNHRLAKISNLDGEAVEVPCNPVKILEGQLVLTDLITLDQIAEELDVDHIDLLAWDIEGAGHEALKGAERLLLQGRIKNFAIDCSHPGEEQCATLLKSNGYKILEDGLVYAKR